jgi:hypothetical protein
MRFSLGHCHECAGSSQGCPLSPTVLTGPAGTMGSGPGHSVPAGSHSGEHSSNHMLHFCGPDFPIMLYMGDKEPPRHNATISTKATPSYRTQLCPNSPRSDRRADTQARPELEPGVLPFTGQVWAGCTITQARASAGQPVPSASFHVGTPDFLAPTYRIFILQSSKVKCGGRQKNKSLLFIEPEFH